MTREEAKRILEFDLDHIHNDESKAALRIAVKALEQTRWIHVSEKLPNKDGTYLVTTKGISTKHIFVETASYAKDLHKLNEYAFESGTGDGWYNFDSEYGYFEVDSVIAWMPLPEPYKTKAEE